MTRWITLLFMGTLLTLPLAGAASAQRGRDDDGRRGGRHDDDWRDGRGDRHDGRGHWRDGRGDRHDGRDYWDDHWNWYDNRYRRYYNRRYSPYSRVWRNRGWRYDNDPGWDRWNRGYSRYYGTPYYGYRDFDDGGVVRVGPLRFGWR